MKSGNSNPGTNKFSVNPAAARSFDSGVPLAYVDIDLARTPEVLDAAALVSSVGQNPELSALADDDCLG